MTRRTHPCRPLLGHQAAPSRRAAGDRRRGSVTVEFAFVASIIFGVFFAAIDFARAMLVQHFVSNAAFEGARTSVVPGTSASAVQARAQTILNMGYVKNAAITVSPSSIVDTTEEVTVTISVPMDNNVWLLKSLFKGKTLVRKSTVAREDY